MAALGNQANQRLEGDWWLCGVGVSPEEGKEVDVQPLWNDEQLGLTRYPGSEERRLEMALEEEEGAKDGPELEGAMAKAAAAA